MTSHSWRGPSRQAAEQQCGIARRVDPEADAAPFDRIALARDEVFHRRDGAALVAGADLDVAKRQPEFVDVARQRDRNRDRIGLIHGLLDETDRVVVFDAEEAQFAGLLQRRVVAPDPVEFGYEGLNVAGLVPIPYLDLVFFGVE